jgi:4-hydroxy 2-oxovalerate aldolase
MNNIKILDCTLRDGGYYNEWNFSTEIVASYLEAMAALKVDFVEIGFRSTNNHGFKGGFAFSTDEFLNNLCIPKELDGKIGVMINASELLTSELSLEKVLEKLFVKKSDSPVSLVRVACHVNEFEQALPAAKWLKSKGYLVGFNLMQIADRTSEEIQGLSKLANDHQLDVLYFADSMGSLDSLSVKHIIHAIQKVYNGEIGIHTHDNMNQALVNSIEAVNAGASWIDGTVTGMGRGPGNVQTEYLAIALSEHRGESGNMTKLLELIREQFRPLQEKYRWGTNPYYYLAGQYGIHPSYIQEMIADSRYNEEDILAVIDRLKVEGGKKFSFSLLDAARHFYQGQSRGEWAPAQIFQDREVLLIGSGPGARQHRKAIEAYVKKQAPIVLALNTQSAIEQSLIDFRVACHPIRLLADCEAYATLPQPLITPASMLPADVLESLQDKKLLDFGLQVQADTFEIYGTHCILPTSLVIAYALAVLVSGKVKKVLLAGFDGYGEDDPRNNEMNYILDEFRAKAIKIDMISITPTRYQIFQKSIYGL